MITLKKTDLYHNGGLLNGYFLSEHRSEKNKSDQRDKLRKWVLDE